MDADSPAEAETRHQMFFAEATKNRAVWGLRNGDGWANRSYEELEVVLPLWSDERTARTCAASSFPGYEPDRIELDTLLEEMLPQLADADVWVGTNLTCEMSGIDVPANVLSMKFRELGVA